MEYEHIIFELELLGDGLHRPGHPVDDHHPDVPLPFLSAGDPGDAAGAGDGS